MTLEEEIQKIAESKIQDNRHFVVEVIVTARKGPKKVLVVIDGDEGVNIDDCAQLSRELSKTMDETSLLGEESYLLEVSTPGVDHPLKMKRQYNKHIGRRLKVKLPDRVEEGVLTAVSEDNIVLNKETGKGKQKETISIDINFLQIEKAFVLVSFK